MVDFEAESSRDVVALKLSVFLTNCLDAIKERIEIVMGTSALREENHKLNENKRVTERS